MKHLSKLGILALFVAILASSCKKENVDDLIINNPNFTPDTVNVNPLLNQMNAFSADTVYISCVAIPYPFDLEQASGNVLTISDSVDLNAAIINPDSVVDFVYPFLAVVNNNSVVINNIQDLGTQIVICSSIPVTCADLDAHVLLFYNALNIMTTNKYLFTINYPVQMIVNGQTVTLNQGSDYLPAIGGNPTRPDEATLVYPITINQFGQTIILNSDQDVCDFQETLDEDCVNKPAHIQFFFNEGGGIPADCAYFINYPVQVNYNGTQLSIQSFSDYTTLLNNDPNVLNGLSMVYPASATKFISGQTLTVSSDSDICQYLDNCY